MIGAGAAGAESSETFLLIGGVAVEQTPFVLLPSPSSSPLNNIY